MSESGPTCLGCGYSLKGLQESSCPECGRAFSWNDRSSYGPKVAQKDPFTMSLAASSPPIWTALLWVPIFFWLVLFGSGPNRFFSEKLLLFLVFVLPWFTIVPWFFWFILHLGARMRLADKGYPQPRWRWKWVALPVTIFLFGAALLSGVGFHIRWALAKSEFTKLAQSGSTISPNQLIGTFRVGSPIMQGGGTLFIPLYESWIEAGGLYYGTTSGGDSNQFIYDLGDGWYLSWSCD